jgi:hypothetical protein
MTEAQQTDSPLPRAAPIHHAPAVEPALDRWESDGGSMQTDPLKAEPAKAATSAVESRTDPPCDPPGGQAVDPDAITERHVFLELEA